MKHIIQFKIYKGNKQYVGECLDLPIVTQGKTVDETLSNIKEALQLHLDGEELAEFDIAEKPSVLVNFELDSAYVHA